jgi:hypothetical protein
VNGKPEYVRSACDASLERLGIDYIDLGIDYIDLYFRCFRLVLDYRPLRQRLFQQPEVFSEAGLPLLVILGN